MNLQIGSNVGDYQIVGILGAGGMGKVYKVRNVISDRIEAMKVLLPDLATEAELADRFLREIKTQASLEHPNIAALHTALRVENQLLMLMEFVEGITLEQRLKEGVLPVEQAIDYISQVLAALDYAHQHGVIHRDIKPANMMLTRSGLVKLMDFGIAKASTDQRLTMTGTTMGSLYYMSPEQIQGAANLDSRADLYSLGVSLYELVTGKRPFDGDSQFAIMSAHLEKTPVPPVEVDPRLPQGLNDAIMMSVARDPGARFQTAAAFRAALSSVLAPAPIVQPEAQPQYQPVPQPTQQQAAYQPQQPAAQATGRGRGLWMAMGALAAVLGAIAVIQFGPWKNTKAESPIVQTPVSQTPTQTPSQPLAQAPVQSPAQIPAQQPSVTPSQPPGQTPSQPSVAKDEPHEQPAYPTGKAKTRKGGELALNNQASPQQAPPTQPTPQQQTPQQQVAQPPVQAPQQQAAAPAQPAGPSLEEVRKAHESFALLETRAGGIRDSLTSLRSSLQSSGMNLSAKFNGPASLMNTYMKGSSDALKANDVPSAKDFMDKAERQIEILEKLLNR